MEDRHPPRLLDQVRERCRVKHYSLRTEKAYVHWIKRTILFHGKRPPNEMGASEVEAFFMLSRDANLHACAQPWRERRAQPARRALKLCGASRRRGGNGFPLPWQEPLAVL